MCEIEEVKTKVCTKCKDEKSYSEFHKNKEKKDGLRLECKICHKQDRKEYYLKNKEKEIEYREKYYKIKENNIKEYSKKYRKINKENLKQKQKQCHKKYSEDLTDGYISVTLNLKKSECPPELIELKRQQLTILRLTKEIKNECKNKDTKD